MAKKSSPNQKAKGGKPTQAPQRKAQQNVQRKAAVAAETKRASADIGPMTVGQKIAWISLHIALFLVPIAMTNLTPLGFQMPYTYDQFDIIKVFFQRGLMIIALAAWGWEILTKGATVRRSKVDWLIVGFLAWVALTTILSISPATAFFGKYRRFEGMLSFITYAGFFFTTMQLVDRPSRIRAVAHTLFFSGVVVSFYGVLQYLGADPINWGPKLPFEFNRAFSMYGNPDLLGGFLMFPLPVALALALSEDDLFWRFVYWLGFLVIIACWITAFTRGAWIGGLVGLVVLAFAYFRLRPGKLQTVDWVLIGSVVAVGAIIVFRSLNQSNEVLNVASRLKSIFQFGEGSANTRFEIWQAAINAIKDRPIFGFGADTFRLVFPMYKPYEYVADAGYLSVADNVHNYPLQLAAGIGIPGFLLLYGIFGFSAYLSAPAAFAKEKGADRLVLAGFWAAAAGYVAHLLFGLSVTGSTFLMWVAMAVVLTPVAWSVKVKAPSWGVIPSAIVVVIAGLLTVGNIVFLNADHYYMLGRVAPQGSLERVTYIETAVRRNPYNDMYKSELGIAWEDVFRALGSQYVNAKNSGQPTTELENQLQQAGQNAEKYLKEAIAFVPSEYDNYVFLTNHYNTAADFLGARRFSELAVEIGLKGIEVEPFGPAIRVQIANAYAALGQSDKALEHLSTAAKMDPNYQDAHMMLGELLVQTGKRDEARKLYESWLTTHPDDPFATQALAALESSAATSPK